MRWSKPKNKAQRLKQKKRYHEQCIAIGKRPYKCDDCDEEQYIHPREFDRRSGVRCVGCGSRHIEPNDTLATELRTQGHDYNLLKCK